MPYRALLEEHLAQAEQSIRSGEERITEQKQTIRNMEGTGRSLELATTVLRLLEHSYRLQLADRDRLRAELAKLPDPPSASDNEPQS